MIAPPSGAPNARVDRGSRHSRESDEAPSTAVCTFDCYGTLVDWHAGVEQTLGSALRAAGYRGTGRLFPVYEAAERAEERGYAPYRDVLAAAAVRAGEQLGVRLSATRAEQFGAALVTWPAFADTADVLRELGARGVRRYILSNVDRDLLEETVRRNQFEVDGVVTAEDVRSYKPAPGHWRRFLADHPADRPVLLHVANSLFHDIVPAHGLGLRTVWVNRYDEPLPADIHPTYTVRTLRELLDHVPRQPGVTGR